MIHEIKRDNQTVFCISADEVWRPGAFASKKAARMAQRLTDDQITELQSASDGVITEEAIQLLAKSPQSEHR